MSTPADTLDPAFFEAHVARAKAAWRKHAQSLTWEEKIAAIERMWPREAALKAAREGHDLVPPLRPSPQPHVPRP